MASIAGVVWSVSSAHSRKPRSGVSDFLEPFVDPGGGYSAILLRTRTYVHASRWYGERLHVDIKQHTSVVIADRNIKSAHKVKPCMLRGKGVELR